MPQNYEVLSIGNAIVDLVSHVDESFLIQQGLEKGAMKLVDEDTSFDLLHRLDDVHNTAGGSAANTAACIASLGASSAYIGKIAADDLGTFFATSMKAAGVDFYCDTPHDDVKTANCLAVVTPDGERTMSTYLGACRELGVGDILEDVISRSSVIFLEGYLMDSPTSAEALLEACRLGRKHHKTIALSLSDSNCVRRHKAAFERLAARGEIDIIIANDREIMALFENHASDLNKALHDVATNILQTTVVTLGADGAAVVEGIMSDPRGRSKRSDYVTFAPARPVEVIIDLVGAGDSFAAGYLVGHARGLLPEQCLSLGTACASEIIATNGARPTRPLSTIPVVAEILTAQAVFEIA